jgi:phosphoribosylglycinamide formyltransferase 1
MHFCRIPDEFANKVVNFHPSLISAFRGKGYYGHRVHEAVVRRSLKFPSYVFVSNLLISNDAKRDNSTKNSNILSTSFVICRGLFPIQLQFGCKLLDCTVHTADNEYDRGPIIFQRAVTAMEATTQILWPIDCLTVKRKALPDALQLFADRRHRIVEGRRVLVVPAVDGAVIKEML